MPRFLLKLSGEALAGGQPAGIDPAVLGWFVEQLRAARSLGAQFAVVLGGGNLFRGARLAASGMQRLTGDRMGMLATCMNALAFADALNRGGIPARAYSSVPMPGLLPGYEADAVRAALEAGEVAALAGGTGNPYFTTDTAACLRGLELGAELVLKATKVDGVYTDDPVTNPQAKRFEELTFDEALARNLGVMDAAAMSLCRDNGLPVLVFDGRSPDALTRIVRGDKVGTRIALAAANGGAH